MHERPHMTALEDLLDRDKAFGHRQHVDLAWQYLHLTDQLRAETWMRDAIKHVAHKHGALDRYNETRTVAWIRLVGTHVRRSDAANFDAFIARNSDLLSTNLLEHFYSSEVLESQVARSRWVEPDVAALP